MTAEADQDGGEWSLAQWVRWACDSMQADLAAGLLRAGDEISCTPEQAELLRPWLARRGLAVEVEDGVGYVVRT